MYHFKSGQRTGERGQSLEFCAVCLYLDMISILLRLFGFAHKMTSMLPVLRKANKTRFDCLRFGSLASECYFRRAGALPLMVSG